MDDRVRELFLELIDLSPAERRKILDDRSGQPEIRAEVESLLRFDSPDDSQIAARVSVVVKDIPGLNGRVPEVELGSYRLLRLLGAGGMGEVYLAERSDGEIQQQVAIKLLRADVNRPVWTSRFLRERQLLASLNHPAIAHVIDAGHTSENRPYLVMEFVDGIPIDQYAAGKALNEVLTLFLLVCDAVSHAHHRLIIHRDLKPSNILVDAMGKPKLLDFGIAKLLDETGEFPETVERLLTPGYASPEQIAGGVQTMATDVYSLGAVLYKLLTGRSPHDSETGTTTPLQIVTGAREIPDPTRLNRAIPNDIVCILRKALRREPEERYASVEALANDVQSFLELRPVQARSGDAWYRTRKLLRRHWIPMTAAVVTVSGLSVGMLVVNRERAIAQHRFNEVRQLSNRLFDIDAEVRNLSGATKSRQLIVDTSLEYLRRLAGDARRDPELSLDLGTAYMRVGRVQGVPIASNLGQPEEAERNLRTAEGLIQSVLSAQPGNRTAMLRMSQITHDRMVLAEGRRPDTDALPLARRSEEWLNRYLASGPIEGADKIQVVIIGMNVANWYQEKELPGEGLRLLRRTIDIAKATGQPHQAGAASIVVCRTLRSQGDLDGALIAITEGVALLKPPADPSIGRVLTYGLALETQGEVLGQSESISLGRSNQAAGNFERALRIGLDAASQDPRDSRSRFAVIGPALKLGRLLRDTNPQKALEVYEQALSRLAEIRNNSKARRQEVEVLAQSTYPLRRLHRNDEARRRIDQAFARLAELKLYPANQIAPGREAYSTLRALADYEAETAGIQQGIATYQKLLQLTLASEPHPDVNLWDANDLSSLYEAMAGLYRRAGQSDAARQIEIRRRDLWKHWDQKLPDNSYVRRQLETARLSEAR